MTEVSVKELRAFGRTMGGAWSLFALVFLWKGKALAATLLGAAALGFFAAGAFAPLALRRVHGRWMQFAEALGKFNLKLILGVIYLVFFSLIHLIFKLTGKDPLQRRFDPEANSYWTDHPPPDDDPRRYERQY